MAKKSKPVGMVWLVLSFIFVQPLGMLLLGLRRMHDRSEWLKSGQSLLKTSLVFFGLFWLFYLVSEPDAQDFEYSFYLFGAGSLIGFIMSYIMISRGKKEEKYKDAILQHRMEKVADIARAVGVDEKTAVADLRKMVADGIFPYAALSRDAKYFESEARHPHAAIKRTIRCFSCGAKVIVIKGRGGICEYCGAVSEYEVRA